MFLVDSLQHCTSYCLTNSTLHFLMTSDVYLLHVCIYVYICYYVRMIFLKISFTYLSIFYISHNGYFHTNALYIKFLINFSLPDVASSVIPLSNVVSIVFSVTVIVGEDTTGKKVDICIDRCLW